MREVNGVVYYTAGDCAVLISRSRQTIVGWDVLSDEMERVKGSRLIPQSIRVKGQQRIWTKEQVREIMRFLNGKKWGDLARVRRELESKRVKKQDRQEQKQRWAVDENMSTNKK